MFTGIITDITPITNQKNNGDILTLTFQRPAGWADLELGESIATDGACLTVSKLGEKDYECELMAETLRKTSFGTKIPDKVNLERSLRMSDRMSGHFVQGHVDGVGTVTTISSGNGGYDLSVEFPEEYQELVIYKGSITINGISLTVSAIDKNVLSVSLIPHTLQHTTIGTLKSGDPVNLEFDMIGKYIAQIVKKTVL